MSVGTIGYWCGESCGHRVPNDHQGPCLICGGRIRRRLPAETAIEFGVMPVPYRHPRTGSAARGRLLSVKQRVPA
jgi:hypothetical protein